MLKRAGERLAGWRRTMILTHERPDGDALGAAGAMKRVIETAGRQASVYVFGEVPPRYAFLDRMCGLDRWPAAGAAQLDGQFDGILVVDTSSWSQIEPAVAYLRGSGRPRIVLDHHATPNELFGRDAELISLIDATAASACSLVWRWCELMGWQVDETAAEALFSGLITDTGWFRFSNTDADTFRAAAAMVERGCRPEVLYARLYETWSHARLRLKARLFDSLEVSRDGQLAVMCLTLADFAETGATQADTEELVNEPMSAETVAVSVLLSEMDGGKIRVNLRSKAPDVCGLDVDVSAVAQSLGGGGHRRAAGARMAGPLRDVKTKVAEAAHAAIERAMKSGGKTPK